MVYYDLPDGRKLSISCTQASHEQINESPSILSETKVCEWIYYAHLSGDYEQVNEDRYRINPITCYCHRRYAIEIIYCKKSEDESFLEFLVLHVHKRPIY